jgi:hypothetical protein
MSWFRTIAVVLCLATAVPALAEEPLPKLSTLSTARGFVDFYKQHAKQQDAEYDMARFYLRGLEEGFAFADVKAINETGRRLFCWPEQFVIVDDQLIDMVDRYVEKYQLGDRAFSLVAAVALTDAFPCKKP